MKFLRCKGVKELAEKENKTPIPICTECGCPLNDDGKCPVCDDVPVDSPGDENGQ